MGEMTLTPVRLKEGVWEGLLRREKEEDHADLPKIEVLLQERPIGGVEVIPDQEGGYVLRIKVPPEAISDGVQTFLIRDQASGQTLEAFTLIAGDGIEGDIRAEIDLLRAELDMLKRAFRRHCLETM